MRKNLISSFILTITLATFSLPGLADDASASAIITPDDADETDVPGE